jgi:hypothetical protein
LRHTLRTLILLFGLVAATHYAAAQAALPTADAKLHLSAFAGATGTYTGLGNGRNLSFTAGVDLGFLPIRGLEPALEYRGTLALDKGAVDSQQNNLIGLKISRPLWRAHPYIDVLYGRGEIDYAPPFQVPGKFVFYTQSSSNIVSPGGGGELDLTSNIALKLDLQLQRYATPVAASGHIFATATTIGLTYRFHFKQLGK